MRYHAFISYSHADSRWAAWLHRKLESYRLPSRLRGGIGEHGPLPERLSPIFRDREDLSSAGHLGPQIGQALADSAALVVVCSPAAVRSPWVDAEIREFKRLGRGERIYGFIVDGEPNAGDDRECFPAALRFDRDADGGLTSADPVAADVRSDKDGSTLARLKLLAGLFGLPLDTLRQREAQRRHRRMFAITALALVVMVATSVLAVQAVIARNAAERRQKQAEALVGFMLGDLNDKLSQVSRLDILASVNDKAMEYFKSLPTTDITDEVLQQRATALVKIGTVRSEQGELGKAMESYQAASRLSGALAAAMPGNIARQLAHAEVLAYIGTMHWYQGDLDGAQRGFDAAQAVLVPARLHAPDNPQLLYQISTIDNNVGHVLEGRGRIEQALPHYRRMLSTARQLVKLGPDNVEWQNQLGLAHNNLAKMALLHGDLATSIAEYRADVVIEEALARRDPRNNAQRERLLISRATLGRTLVLAGELEEGTALTRQAVDDARALVGMEPGSMAFQEDVGLYTTQLARMQRLRGDLDAATALSESSLATLQGMVAKDATQPVWRRELAEAHVERAEQAIARGQREAALGALRSALAILQPLIAQAAEDRGIVLATAGARLQLASLLADNQRAALADQALATLAAQTSAREDPRLLALRVQSLRLLERMPEARKLATSLAASGYRDPGLLPLPGSTRTPVPTRNPTRSSP